MGSNRKNPDGILGAEFFQLFEKPGLNSFDVLDIQIVQANRSDFAFSHRKWFHVIVIDSHFLVGFADIQHSDGVFHKNQPYTGPKMVQARKSAPSLSIPK